MKINFTIINPSGNITALVKTKIPKSRRPDVAKKIMENYLNIEQVGFNVNDNLEMMGGELSLLGTLAFGYYLWSGSGKSFYYTSGVKEPVGFYCRKLKSTIALNIKSQISKVNGLNFVDLGGIAYFVVPYYKGDYLTLFEIFRKRFEKKIERNAWGVVFYKGNRIYPVVYVKDKKGNVLEKRLENACGSGSLAYFLITGREKIIQPSGQVLEIKKSGNQFFLKGKVKIVSQQNLAL